ncbi:MAG: cytochrome P450 [Saprospiraceae bacterium]
MKKQYQYPEGYSLLQTTLKTGEFLKDPIRFINKSMEQFGDTYTATVGTQKMILTKNPEFIDHILRTNQRNYERSEITAKRGAQFFGKGLLFTNGEYWLKQRRLIQPAFHRKKIKGLYQNIQKTITDYLADFPTGEEVDIYPIMQDLSFRVLIKSLFEIDLSKEIMDELNQIFADLSSFLLKDVNMPLRKLMYPFTGEERKHLRKGKRLREIILGIVNERKASNGEFHDILDMLINSRYEDTGEAMTEDQLVDEVQILISAGHETTGNTLSWLMYNLANNSASQQQLQASIDDSTIDQVMDNTYLRACISESMRLFTTSWTSERVAIVDDSFGAYSFPKGTVIAPFFFGVHRDETLWKDALHFKPERFIEDEKLAKSKKYFPFGAGPRMCIGNSFALAEISCFLHTFFQSFKTQTIAKTPALMPLLTLRPDQVVLKIKKR